MPAPERTLAVGDSEFPLGERTYVMGVLNVSPESKNTDTVVTSVDGALRMADRYRELGAALIDVGGQSSHYDTPTIDPADEISRVVPVIEALRSAGHVVAVDTWKAGVADSAVSAGAVIVNDTGGLADAEMRRVVAATGVAAIAVHVEARNPHQVDEIELRSDKAQQIADRFRDLLADLATIGIDNLILDPGIAVSYRGDYRAYSRMQLEVVAGTHHLHALGMPVLIPVPRKREAYHTAAYIALALEHRADIVRVHDVAMACDIARLFGRGP